MVEVGAGTCRDAQGRYPNYHYKNPTGTQAECDDFCLANEKCTGASYRSFSGGDCTLSGNQLTEDNKPDGWYFYSGNGDSDVITQGNGNTNYDCSRKTTPPATTTPGAVHT